MFVVFDPFFVIKDIRYSIDWEENQIKRGSLNSYVSLYLLLNFEIVNVIYHTQYIIQ